LTPGNLEIKYDPDKSCCGAEGRAASDISAAINRHCNKAGPSKMSKRNKKNKKKKEEIRRNMCSNIADITVNAQMQLLLSLVIPKRCRSKMTIVHG
jgi:hypothetical protein